MVAGEKAGDTVTSTLATLSSSHLAEQAANANTSEQRAAIDAVMQRVKQIDGPLDPVAIERRSGDGRSGAAGPWSTRRSSGPVGLHPGHRRTMGVRFHDAARV